MLQRPLLWLGFTALSTALQPYLTWMADSFIERGVDKTGGYGQAVFYDGLTAAYESTGNETYPEWEKGQIDGYVVLDNGSLLNWNLTYYALDNYRIGNNILWWYNRTGELKYKTAADIIRHQLDRHSRTPTGGFWHKEQDPNQMWLDGIFMGDTFYAKWTNMFDADNTTAWDDVILQYDHIEAHCRNQTSKLLVHGYDESKLAEWADPVTGASPLVWDRADGWYFWTLLEAIQLFPTTHSGYAKLVTYFQTLAEGLLAAQDESGGWWLVMSEPYPGMTGNYIESSASAMFTYGWLKGMRLGLLSEDDYLAPAEKAYQLLTDRFVVVNDNGTLSWTGTVSVGSLGAGNNATFEVSAIISLMVRAFLNVLIAVLHERSGRGE